MTNKEQYKLALLKWKTDKGLDWYARFPSKPTSRQGEDAIEFAKRLMCYNKSAAIWKSAPKPEDFNIIRPLHEKYEIRLSLVLRFGAQHVKLFNYRLLSELEEFEMFLIKLGIRYEYIEKQNSSIEINFDDSTIFVLSEESAPLRLAVESSDGVHITGFYFYNEKGYKDEKQRVNTIADLHDFFMKDKRVVTKKIKSEKDCRNFIQDYIAPYEAARVEDNSVYITTIEQYKKLPKYKWDRIKGEWIVAVIMLLVLASVIMYGFFGTNNKKNTNSFYSIIDDAKESVYICTGPKAKSYHRDEECYGLQSCSAEVEEISIDEAENQGRHPCRYCCK